MFTSTLMGHYIPITWLTFGLDYTLWGMNPLGYHLTNTLIHSANAALFYLIAVRLLAKAMSLTGPALHAGGAMATLFFALHPLRAESVAWATERRDVLSGLFFLLTILVYLKAHETQGAPRRRLLGVSVACYALALLSKSIVMTLPFVLVLLDIYPLGRLQMRWTLWRQAAGRAVLIEKLPYLALGLLGAVTSFWAVASNDFLTPVERYGWFSRIEIAAHSGWFYLEKTLVPLALSPLYELPAVVNPLELRFLVSSAIVVAISAAVLALRRRWPAGAGPLGLLLDRPRPGQRDCARGISAGPRPLQLPVLPRVGAARGRGDGARRAVCGHGRVAACVQGRGRRRGGGYGSSRSVRSPCISCRSGGTPIRCGGMPWTRIPLRRMSEQRGCRDAQRGISSTRQAAIRAGSDAATGPLARAQRAGHGVPPPGQL